MTSKAGTSDKEAVTEKHTRRKQIGFEYEKRENVMFHTKCCMVLKVFANIRNYLDDVCALSDTKQVLGLLVG